jgi:hypothetical protein
MATSVEFISETLRLCLDTTTLVKLECQLDPWQLAEDGVLVQKKRSIQKKRAECMGVFITRLRLGSAEETRLRKAVFREDERWPRSDAEWDTYFLTFVILHLPGLERPSHEFLACFMIANDQLISAFVQETEANKESPARRAEIAQGFLASSRLLLVQLFAPMLSMVARTSSIA